MTKKKEEKMMNKYYHLSETKTKTEIWPKREGKIRKGIINKSYHLPHHSSGFRPQSAFPSSIINSHFEEGGELYKKFRDQMIKQFEHFERIVKKKLEDKREYDLSLL